MINSDVIKSKAKGKAREERVEKAQFNNLDCCFIVVFSSDQLHKDFAKAHRS